MQLNTKAIWQQIVNKYNGVYLPIENLGFLERIERLNERGVEVY